MTTDEKYNIDNYLNDVLQKKYDNKPDRMIRMVLEDGTVIIGKHRYDALKKIPGNALLISQKEQIKTFEDYHGITEYLKNIAKNKEIVEEKIQFEKKRIEDIEKNINVESVRAVFFDQYKKYNKKEFEITSETKENIEPLIRYFAKDESFLNYGVKNAKGNFISNPSLDKGLCIIGGFGNGKTSVMTTFQKMFIGLPNYSFGRFSAHELVLKYEQFSKYKDAEALENYWKMLTKGDLYIDDVKSEPDVLAFGKRNLLDALFQERYHKFLQIRTHITMNYANGKNGDVMAAIQEVKTRYSNQVYDRFFEMYNVIEFKGKSFRR